MLPDGLYDVVKDGIVVSNSKRAKSFSFYHDDLGLNGGGKKRGVPADMVIC
jgi:hypothetical protein